MKSRMPWWFCVAAIANVDIAFANDGIDAYRLGQYNKAATAFKSTINQDPIVDYYIARMRLYGYGELKNNALAIRYFKAAAEKKFLPAQQIMARYELLEKNNPEQALYWFKKAAESNDVSAQMYCAAAYLFGLGVHKNADMAKRYYIAAAKNGDSIAQYTLAQSFFETRHAANKKLGLLWLNKSIEQKNPEAQVMLAEQYTNGTLLERDIDKAKELTNLAIQQNYGPAFYQMGQIERSQNNIQEAEKWYNKAVLTGFVPAAIALSEIYSDDKSALYNAHEGFLWMLKGAQMGSIEAQRKLSEMYKKGFGTESDQQLANEWQQKATISSKESDVQAQEKAVQWLTNGKAGQFAKTAYAMQGILGQWHNPLSVQQNNYNSFPAMESVTRQMLYQPQFSLVNPTQVPINEYYDMLVRSMEKSNPEQWNVPRYGFHAALQAKADDNANQMMTVDELKKMATAADQAADYKELFKKLESQAILGDANAQFDLGQMYQYGIGVEKNIQNAIKNYQLAAVQQDLQSEYNLGLLYLFGIDIDPDYKLAVEWLDDAAFKGNPNAQYVLARIYELGYKDAAGKEVIAPDPEQAMAMYNLASANGSGLAQYRLAEILVRQKPSDLSIAGFEKHNQLIKTLYTGAVAAGIEAANLPLAFYDAMDSDKNKQQQAFNSANKEANAGNKDAALLLGLMYDRGIAVEADQDKALTWYEQATDNPVSAFILGTYTAQGIGGSKDLQKSRELLQKAVDSGFSYANLNLAIIKKQQGESFLPELIQALNLGNSKAGLLLADYYVNQSNQDDNLKQAHVIFQQFAEKGDAQAQLKLGFLYEQGIGCPVNFTSAQTWYTAAAEQQQPQAQYLLARLYQLGRLDKLPDYSQAKKWYAAAQTNYPPASVALGFIYDTVDENYAQAMASYQRAADQGDMVGAYNLGLLYERGEGCAVDIDKAKSLYLQAIEKGHSQAMVQLANLYLSRQDKSGDAGDALDLYKKAMALGNRDAMYQLGLMAETGVATSLDYAQATHYYQMASERGNAKATLALARMYQYGLGGSKNLQEAEKLYSELSAQSNPYAQYQMALFCFKGITPNCQPQQAKQWLQKAQENGSMDAQKALQWYSAQSQPHVSFIASAQLTSPPVVERSSAELMYLSALNAWNLGDEKTSKEILVQLLNEYPNNALAKEAYQQLMNSDSSISKQEVGTKNTAYLQQ
ncbi:MAG: tetratricopeptide repeat protein [Legionellaceae bacterium]|nr:tetratricopeptide repeat protein [Legionellaceae bacterium]